MHFKNSPCDLPFSTYKNIFKETQLTSIQFCGNKGDAIFHPEFNKILDYTIDQGVYIYLATNGSNFSKKWWYDLAKKIKGEVVFALDGLEDTHQIYRSTSFKKVYSNMLAFIEGGGNATWQYILFKHNEHQLEKAKKLSKEIGCKQFITLISRYYDEIMQKPTSTPATKRELHSHSKKIKELYKYPNIKKYIYKVSCQWVSMKRVYVSSRGRAYPCCYICCYVHDWFTKPGLKHLRSIKKPEYNIANNTLNKIIKLPSFVYIYDNVDNLAPCDLNCTNIKIYKNKIRKVEAL
jgi:hypothetical protein